MHASAGRRTKEHLQQITNNITHIHSEIQCVIATHKPVSIIRRSSGIFFKTSRFSAVFSELGIQECKSVNQILNAVTSEEKAGTLHLLTIH